MAAQHDGAWTWLFGRPEGVRQTLWAQITGRFDPEAVLAASRSEASPDGDSEAGADLIAVDAVPDGGVVEVLWDGRPVAIARRGDAIHVLDGTCTHAGGPLGEGVLSGDQLVCPWHGFRFDLADGSCEVAGAEGVRVWPATVVDGRVRVTTP